jgi:hypothetical protein
MRDSKLYEWMQKLQWAEQSEFLRYVELMGGKNRDALHQLLDLFLAKVMRGKGMSREEFFNLWRPGTAYDANLLRKRMTALKKLLGEYLSTTELLRQPLASTQFMLKALQQRGWTDLILPECKSAKEQLGQFPIDENHFHNTLQIEDCYVNRILETPRKWRTPVLQSALDDTDLHFILQKLRYACAAYNLDRISGTQHAEGMLPQVLHYIAQTPRVFPPIVRLYYRAYIMLTEPQEPSHFIGFQAELADHAATLSKSIAQELYKFAINHCIGRLNSGEPHFAAALHQLYQDLLGNHVLLTKGTIEAAELKNMMALVLQTGNVPLAEILLEEYGTKLAQDAEPTAVQYHEALIAYYKKEFSKARKLCDLVIRDAQDPFYILDARVCLWRSSFELGDWEYSLAQYDAFRMFLSRAQHLSPQRIASYQQFATHFFSFLRILSKYPPNKHNRKDIELRRLLAKLEAAPDINYLVWLRNKIKEALEIQ